MRRRSCREEGKRVLSLAIAHISGAKPGNLAYVMFHAQARWPLSDRRMIGRGWIWKSRGANSRTPDYVVASHACWRSCGTAWGISRPANEPDRSLLHPELAHILDHHARPLGVTGQRRTCVHTHRNRTAYGRHRSRATSSGSLNLVVTLRVPATLRQVIP